MTEPKAWLVGVTWLVGETVTGKNTISSPGQLTSCSNTSANDCKPPSLALGSESSFYAVCHNSYF